jgi:hypothetical protein
VGRPSSAGSGRIIRSSPDTRVTPDPGSPHQPVVVRVRYSPLDWSALARSPREPRRGRPIPPSPAAYPSICVMPRLV